MINKKIIFSAGGTGGHIFPAINLMKHFYEKGYNVVLVTDKRGNNFLNKNSKFKSYELRTGTPTSKNILGKKEDVYENPYIPRYDDYIFWPYMIITYDDRIWGTYMNGELIL